MPRMMAELMGFDCAEELTRSLHGRGYPVPHEAWTLATAAVIEEGINGELLASQSGLASEWDVSATPDVLRWPQSARGCMSATSSQMHSLTRSSMALPGLACRETEQDSQCDKRATQNPRDRTKSYCPKAANQEPVTEVLKGIRILCGQHRKPNTSRDGEHDHYKQFQRVSHGMGTTLVERNIRAITTHAVALAQHDAHHPYRSVENSSLGGAHVRHAVVFLCPSQRHRAGDSRSLFMGGKALKYNTRKGNTARRPSAVSNFPPTCVKAGRVPLENH